MNPLYFTRGKPHYFTTFVFPFTDLLFLLQFGGEIVS